MTKFEFNLYAFVFSAILMAACAHPDTSSERPNILFIMSDDHTSQAWGIYGGVLENYARNENIKRLAAEGAVLNNAFCTNSICVPSRASILTGQYSHQNGVYALADSLSPNSPSISSVLQSNGYQTAVVGKWHLKSRPVGFDHYLVLPGQGVYNNPILKDSATWKDTGRRYSGFSADVITEKSIEFLNTRNHDKPFFLMTHFKATHEPFDYPDRLADLYRNDTIPEPGSLLDFSPNTNGRSFTGQKLGILYNRWLADAQKPESSRRYPGEPVYGAEMDSITRRKATYQKFIKDFLRCGAAIDENIGRLLDYLDKNNLRENTIVIYTSDQGYFLGEHGMFDKRMIYEEAIRMPFVIRYPKEIPSGSRLEDIVLNIDFPATFLDYAGVPKPDFIEGRSFRQNLVGQSPQDWRKDMYYRYWLHRTERPAHIGIRTKRHKLAYFYGEPLDINGAMSQSTPPAWEFYDLFNDPKELHNAIDDQAYARVIDSLKIRLTLLKVEVNDLDHVLRDNLN